MYWVYQTIISLRGWWPAPPLPPARTLRRFAVLVPAHNEERVIGPLLDSLNEQDYPRSLFDIYVACDACTDRTAEIAAQRGAIPLVHRGPRPRGKTRNVRAALARIPLHRYDAVAMFDADNLVAPDFLSRMNDLFDSQPDAEAAQGYLETKNPSDSWVTRVYAVAYWYTNRFWQLARANWGLSATLGGTGLVLRTSCIRRVGWDLESLTEDLEFSTRLVLAGGKVYWNEWAVTYDEKPVTHRASWRQRTRWMQGHYWVLWRYGPKLLRAFLQTGRLQYLDHLFYLLAPVAALAAFLAPAARWFLGREASFESVLWAWLALFALHGTYQLVAGPSLRRRRLTLRYVRTLLPYLWYGLTWAPILLYASFRAGNQGHWVKTPHTRNMTIRDILAGGSS